MEDPRHQVPRVNGGDADCRLIHPKLGGGRARFLEAQADVQRHADVDTLRLHFSGADACCEQAQGWLSRPHPPYILHVGMF